MEYIIIFIALAFLVGTIQLAMPTKKEKRIALLRSSAILNGFRIEYGIDSVFKQKNSHKNNVCYSLKNTSSLKEGHFIRDNSDLNLYSPIKLKYEESFDNLKTKVNDLPFSITEIIFFEETVSFLWNETGDEEVLKKIGEVIKKI